MRTRLSRTGLALALLAAAAGAQDPVFQTLHSEFTQVGSHIASGDFDEDGLPDAAAEVGGTLRLLFGRGDGTFQADPRTIVPGMAARYVVAADVSGDGHLDLLASDTFNGTVQVALGAGDGSFAPPTLHAVDSEPAEILVTDMNGDAFPDLAVGNNLGVRVSVLLGTGGGAFAPWTSYGPAGSRPRRVAGGDFDGDGDTDLAFANFYSDFVSVFLNNGDGSLAAPTTLPTVEGPAGVAAGDLDEDGHIDLLVQGGGQTHWFAGLGNGGFAAPVALPGSSYSGVLHVLDADEDGHPDVAAISNQSVSVVRGHGDGSFDPPALAAVAVAPIDFTPADFDLDGELDFATIDGVRDGIAVTLGRGDLAFGPNLAAPSLPSHVAVGDLDGDGLADIVASNSGGSTVGLTLWRGLGDGWFGAGEQLGDLERPGRLLIAHLDGDSHPDVAVSNTGLFGGRVQVLHSDGAGGFQAPQTLVVANDLFDLAVGDIDGNGSQDLVTVSNALNAMSILFADGSGGFQAPVTIPTWLAPAGVAVGDLDGDADEDIVTVHWVGSDAVQVHLNDGNGTFAAAVAVDTNLVDHGGTLADVDGNGTLDLIAVSYWGQRVVVYPGLGDGGFGAALPNDAQWNPGGFGVGDVDGDDIPDIVVAQAFEFFDEGQAALLVGNGDGTFGPQVKFDLPADATDAVLGDVDGDGVLDAIVAVKNANHVAVLRSRRGPWDDLLMPLAGTYGYPHQTGEGPLLGGEPFRFTLTDAPPLTSAWHFVGLTELSAPFKGGTLVPFPHLINGPLPVGADGRLVLTGPWPNGAPSGVSIWLQFWMPDAGGPAGFAASNAVKATLP